MSKVTKFECDVTGETFGAKNFVYEYELRRKLANSPFEISTRTVHISEEAIEESGLKSHYHVPSPSKVEYLGIEGGEIVGAYAESGGGGLSNEVYEWRPRDGVVSPQWVEFYEFLEAELIL